MQTQITVCGNVGKDAILSQTKNGNPLLKFSVATKQKMQTGEDKTIWFEVTCFGTHAEFHRGILKGDKIVVIGRFEYQEFAKQDGSKGTSFGIVASDLEQANHRWPDQRNDTKTTAPDIDLDSLPF